MKRYRLAIGLLTANVVLGLLAPGVGWCAIRNTAANCREMLMVLPPIFVLIGLLDAWVDRETMTRLMGRGAGLKGVLMAFTLGSVAAGPLYAAFPIVAVLLRKGSSLTNAIIFIGAWTTTKVPMLLFETSTMGWRFALLRFILDVPAIVLIAHITQRTLSSEEKDTIRQNALLL